MGNNSAPPKWSKLWTDIPQPGDHIGAYSTEQLERMNQEFTAAVERAFRGGRRERDGGDRNVRLEAPMTVTALRGACERAGAMTTVGKNRIMIFGPKSDGTYVIEFRTAPRASRWRSQSLGQRRR